MNLELFRQAAAQNQWSFIAPELALGCLALFLLVAEILLPKKAHDYIPGLAIVGQVGVLAALARSYFAPLPALETFSGLLRHSPEGQFMRMFFVFASILVSALGTVALAKQKMPKVEFFHIVIVVTAAMMLLVQSNHFVMLFVALETVTIGFYILVSYVRTNALSLEAGLKYLISGALSSAILLFGIVLLYGVAGTPSLPGAATDPLHFDQLRRFLELNPDNVLANIGIVLVLSGILFKVGAVPFQIWIPDVYQGAPTPVTAFLAVSSKAAGISVLLALTTVVFFPCRGVIVPVLSIIAAATILFGNFAALTQHNVKRLIGLSGVSHAGYLVLGVLAAVLAPREDLAEQAHYGIYFYLVTYLLASFAVFGVMVHLAGTDDADQELDHYTHLAKDRPFLALVLTVGLGSLAGIPPLAGFLGKLLIFIAAFHAGLYWLLAISIVGVIVSIYYYFGWIKAAVYPSLRASERPAGTASPARTALSPGLALVLALLALVSVLFGFYQAPVNAWLAALL
jgi:NADH-quinone oxidoreductase subunit N